MRVPAPTLRIFSDLHFADPGSWLERVDMLKPLLEGADKVVLNGDTLDTQITNDPDALVAEVKQFFAENTADALFVTGNHDPDISKTHETSLADGRVWVTHGHVFFDDVAPWSRLVPELRHRFRRHIEGLTPSDLKKLETRYEVFRQVCLKLPREVDPNAHGPFARVSRIIHALLPPTRIPAMLRAWRQLPQLAARVSAEQRPAAQVIITGHTHYHGVWTLRNGRTVINTGSFCPPRGGQLVEISDEILRVRSIVRRRGQFHLGSTVAEIALAPHRRSALSATA